MDVTVTDPDGLAAISNLSITNGVGSITPSTPFAPGAKSAVVTAIKTTQGAPTRWSFDAIDVVGHVKHCE